jgi:single-strand DNA-binding protein
MNVTSFSVATNRNWTDWNWNKQDQTEFHNIVLWWKLAEIASEYLKKWQKVYVEWRLQTRDWEAQDGSKRYLTEIIWENIILLWNKGETTNRNDSQVVNNEPNEEISIEDIPF